MLNRYLPFVLTAVRSGNADAVADLVAFPSRIKFGTGAHEMLRRSEPVQRRCLSLFLLGMLQGCVFVPVTTEVYDPGCRVVSKTMELQPVQVAALGSCRNNECAALLAFAGATAAASAVISGSIVVVGNVAYWFEKQGRCRREN